MMTPLCLAPPLAVREATDSDRALLLAVYASTRADELAVLPWTPAEKAAFLEMQFTAQDTHYRAHYPGALYLVVEHAGAAVGRLYLHLGPSETRIMDIAILPEFQRRGHGSALILAVLDQARARGCAVGIHVEKYNPALRLYERLGFAIEADRGVYWFMVWRGVEEAAP